MDGYEEIIDLRAEISEAFSRRARPQYDKIVKPDVIFDFDVGTYFTSVENNQILIPCDEVFSGFYYFTTEAALAFLPNYLISVLAARRTGMQMAEVVILALSAPNANKMRRIATIREVKVVCRSIDWLASSFNSTNYFDTEISEAKRIWGCEA